MVHERPGVTRDRNEVECEWNGRTFTLIDTGGVTSATRSAAGSIREQARAGRRSAGGCAGGRRARGVRPGDEELADLLRRSPVSSVVVANKCDTVGELPLAADHRLGLGEPLAVSAARDSVRAICWIGSCSCCPRRGGARARDAAPRADRPPNVGKSSLVNRFLGEERVIVSELAGTTRDAIDTPLLVEERAVTLIDTAGMRRQSKVADSVEYYTALRSRRAAERADVALVVCDATEGITAQDLRSPSWR